MPISFSQSQRNSKSEKEFRSSGVQEFRSSGVQEFRSSGVQEFRSSGVQGCMEHKVCKKKAPSVTDVDLGLLNSRTPATPELLSHYLPCP
jgi:hypothetical protein